MPFPVSPTAGQLYTTQLGTWPLPGSTDASSVISTATAG